MDQYPVAGCERGPRPEEDSVSLRLLRKWLPVLLLVMVWALGWLAAWRLFLFDLLAVEAGPQATIFPDAGGDLVTLLVGLGTTVVLGTFGYLLLVNSSAFSSYGPRWSRVWLVVGTLLVVVGLVAPILYPSTRAMVVDPGRAVVTLEQRWLYAETADVTAFEEIARVGLRVRRTLVGRLGGCRVATGLSIIRVDRTWLDVPAGFDHEAVARSVSELADVPLESLGTRQC